ncbi:hypothetical protein V5799_020911, partial [Amblyomma americanum]
MGLQLLLLLLVAGWPVAGSERLAFTRTLYRASIPENSASKRYVQPSEKMGVHVDSSHLQVRYKIVAGDKERQFKAESRLVGDFWLLLIRTRSESTSTVALNREYEDSYRVRVKGSVHDTLGHRRLPDVHCEVLIQVTDKNDLSPLFFPTVYNATVPEDTPLHHVLVKLNAYDPDLGVNGEIYYRLLEPSRQFAVHPTMGTILLTRPLDFQRKPIHQLTVVAEDRGPKPKAGSILKSSTAQVVVRVEPVNRHRPAIFVRHVHALVEAPEVWAVVVVTDDDPGIHGTIGGLDIVDGDADDHFTVVAGSQPGEYSLRIDPRRPLNPRGYTLTLRAWDQGTPSQFTDEKVSINLSELNNVVPQLERSHYEAEISEEAPPGTPLVQVKAGVAGSVPLVYHIESGNEDGHFALNPATGRLSIAHWLDHEARANYSLEVSVTNSAARGARHKAVAIVTIRVLDFNDHAPVFDPSIAEILLEENKPVGTKVFTVHAHDEDEAENGYVSYSLVNLNTVPFSIDPFSGEVSTTEVLDYETMRRSYTLRIRATDWGAPYQRQAEMALMVTLRDVNDHRPQFEKVDCIATVSQQAAAGSQVLTLSAVDFDDGGTGRVHYKMEASSDSTCFHLNTSTGVLSLACQLRKPARVNVTATDGHHFADVMMVLVRPMGQQASVECKDAGVIDKLRRQLQLSERNNAQGKMLDHGEPTAASFLENRHSPQLSWPDDLSVNESLLPGSVLGYVKAKDQDHGYNGRLVYAISSGDHHSCFRVDMQTGALLLTAPLDYELASSHLLNVTAYDQGQPPRSSSQTLFIRVLDVNDNAPLFEKSAYNFVINEDAPNGTSVARLRASDRDQGPNAELHFQLDSEQFHLDDQTGLLTVHGPLDRERHDKHLLIVTVADKAPQDPLSSTATVSIVLRDVNDNAPRFALAPYVVRIREDLPVGTLVTSVHAEDADFGENGRVQYSLDGQHAGVFDIDPDTGLIRLAASLDFETLRLYNVSVQAQDCGDPPFSSVASLIVEVQDVNENLHSPVFPEQVRAKARVRAVANHGVLQVSSVSVDENQPPGTFVTTLAATDEDGVTYAITSGNGLGLFSVDDNGTIRSRVSLDRETCAHYWLTVVARDLSPVPLEARLDLHVAVNDVNDQVPLTEQPAYNVTVPEDAPPGTSVLTLAAQDEDSPTVHFRLADDAAGRFAIDSRSGVITTAKVLDREVHERHVLEVVISDGGQPPLSSTTQVLITLTDVNDHEPQFTQPLYRFPEQLDHEASQRHMLTVAVRDAGGSVTRRGFARVLVLVADHNDHAPEFLQARYEVRVSETATPGTALLQLGALDRDRGRNALLTFAIASGNTGSTFSLEPTLGLLTLARELSRQTQPEFFLMVRAMDHGEPPLNSTATVHVVVTLADNAPPNFEPAEQTIEVAENQPAGAFLLAFTVRSSSSVFFQLQQGAGSHFRLDPVTGVLSTGDEVLDYEQAVVHNLTVRAINLAGAMAQGHVTVRVLDSNDHAPRFRQLLYHGTVSEAAPAGSAVLRYSQPLVVVAEDEDTGLNAQLSFSIVEAWARRLFRIDANTGALSLVQPLDRELQAEYNFTVEVSDCGQPRLSAQQPAMVSIRVSDVNDSPPRFEHEQYNASLLLPTYAGVRVVQVAAHDPDLEGPSLRYTLMAGDHEGHFEVRPDTGEVVVREPSGLQGLYRLLISASDGRSETATLVLVTVGRANTGHLRFVRPLWEAAVRENEPAEQRVTLLSVLGTAVGEPVRFSLLTPSDHFAVSTYSGLVRCLAPLDREERAFHELALEARSARAVAHALLRVRVLDENDKAPIFVDRPYHSAITVDAQPGDLVLKVKAIDLDEGPNGKVSYFLHEGDGQTFGVDEQSGEIRLLRAPSRRDELALVLVARDHGAGVFQFFVHVSDQGNPRPLWAVVPVTVAVVQPPEELPVLGVSTRDLHVRESAALGSPLLALAPGTTLLGSSEFSIDAGNNLVIAAPLDREHQASHQLTLRAETPRGLASALDVTVHVMDVNDCEPVFDVMSYQTAVAENAEEGCVVARLVAHDPDVSVRRVTYEFYEETDPAADIFRIDPQSGVITTLVALDREAVPFYNFTVRARDDGLLSSSAWVYVEVLDVNDNPPVFEQTLYQVQVSEDAVAGTVVASLRVEDADKEPAPVGYYVLSGDPGQQFAVRSSGDVFVQRPLDREARQNYTLRVVATDGLHVAMTQLDITILDSNDNPPICLKVSRYALEVECWDGGTPPLSARALVHLEVLDVNDHPPRFDQSNYTAVVHEGRPVGWTVLRFSLSDADSAAHGPPFRLELLDGAQAGQEEEEPFFQVEGHELRLARPLPPRSRHELRVQAHDSGSPPLATEAHVTVLAVEKSRFRPQ